MQQKEVSKPPLYAKTTFFFIFDVVETQYFASGLCIKRRKVLRLYG